MTEIERTIMPPEEWFFNQCGSGGSMCPSLPMWVLTSNFTVPVLVLFTKFDALLGQAMADLEEENDEATLNCDEILIALPARAKKIFESYEFPSKFGKKKYPPKGHVIMEGKFHLLAGCIIDGIELGLKQKCMKMETAQN